MSAGYTELFMEQGATFSSTIAIADLYGDVFNLTGFTAHSQMRKSFYSTSVAGSFTTSIDSGSGTITLAMSVSDTLNIKPGRYVFDVIIRNNSDATITRILEGIVNVSPAVTRL